MYPHRIRLRGPWEVEPISRLVHGQLLPMNLPPAFRVTMPCHWRETPLAGFSGKVRLLRRFGYPGNIDAFERIWLTIAGLADRAEITLNGQSLGSCSQGECPWECDITSILGPRNELIVLLESANDAGGLWGEVALEIRRTAYLRNLHVQQKQEGGAVTFLAQGEVIGISDRPLDLYLLRDDRTLAHTTIEPTSAGNPFQLTSEPLELAVNDSFKPGTVRLDLIDGGVVWYSCEVLLAPLPS